MTLWGLPNKLHAGRFPRPSLIPHHDALGLPNKLLAGRFPRPSLIPHHDALGLPNKLRAGRFPRPSLISHHDALGLANKLRAGRFPRPSLISLHERQTSQNNEMMYSCVLVMDLVCATKLIPVASVLAVLLVPGTVTHVCVSFYLSDIRVINIFFCHIFIV